MDKSLFTACRYTGKVKTVQNETEFRVCFNCGGITHKTVGDPRKTVYDLTVNNTVASTEETVPVTDLLKQEAFRCSYCAEVLPDYSELHGDIDAIQLRHDNTTEGTEIGECAVGSKATLQAAIDVAVDFVTTVDKATTVIGENETIDGLIIDTFETLDTAYSVFVAGIVPIPNKTALGALLISANASHTAAVEGADIGEYAVGSKATFKAAIDAAQLVYADDTAVQSEVDGEVITLQAAVDAFEGGKVPAPDKTALGALLVSANALHDGAVEGVAIGEYAVGSKATFKTAIDTAQAVYDDVTVLQAAVDDAVIDLQTAVTTFEGGIVS